MSNEFNLLCPILALMTLFKLPKALNVRLQVELLAGISSGSIMRLYVLGDKCNLLLVVGHDLKSSKVTVAGVA